MHKKMPFGLVDHVQLAPSTMGQIAAIRIHMDPCDESSGALRVVPYGRLNSHQIREMSASGETICAANSGDVLIMSPLIIHASSPAISPRHRRVLHMEYSEVNLPAGLQWHESF